jgi:hypothetical protein
VATILRHFLPIGVLYCRYCGAPACHGLSSTSIVTVFLENHFWDSHCSPAPLSSERRTFPLLIKIIPYGRSTQTTLMTRMRQVRHVPSVREREREEKLRCSLSSLLGSAMIRYDTTPPAVDDDARCMMPCLSVATSYPRNGKLVVILVPELRNLSLSDSEAYQSAQGTTPY